MAGGKRTGGSWNLNEAGNVQDPPHVGLSRPVFEGNEMVDLITYIH
jgi:hypothetical protein